MRRIRKGDKVRLKKEAYFSIPYPGPSGIVEWVGRSYPKTVSVDVALHPDKKARHYYLGELERAK